MSMRSEGRFIVFEGLDGAGTTTQARLLAERLARDMPQRRVHVTAEPSLGPIGQVIRQVLKGRMVGLTAAGTPVPLDRRALALLFAADRLDHLACEVRPLLDEGYLVISDRYALSSLAYQGLDVDRAWVAEINRHAPAPDIQFFLETPAETGWHRIQGTRPGNEIFEAPETLAKVAESYRQSLDLFAVGRTRVIDGTLSREDVAGQVWSVLHDAGIVP